MIESIDDPRPETGDLEKHSFLAQLIELRISIQQSRRDKLLNNSQDERGKHREDDVVERECPGFVDDLAGERVLEGELDVSLVKIASTDRQNLPRTESC